MSARFLKSLENSGQSKPNGRHLGGFWEPLGTIFDEKNTDDLLLGKGSREITRDHAVHNRNLGARALRTTIEHSRDEGRGHSQPTTLG